MKPSSFPILSYPPWSKNYQLVRYRERAWADFEPGQANSIFEMREVWVRVTVTTIMQGKHVYPEIHRCKAQSGYDLSIL